MNFLVKISLILIITHYLFHIGIDLWIKGKGSNLRTLLSNTSEISKSQKIAKIIFTTSKFAALFGFLVLAVSILI